MFARTLRMELKPQSATEFSNVIEKEVLPSLRKRQGLQGEIVFVGPGGTEAIQNHLVGQERERRRLST